MADPNTIVPYGDSFDSTFSNPIFNFDENSNPILADFNPIANPFSLHSSIPQLGDGSIGDVVNPVDDPIMWEDFVNDLTLNDSQAGPSEIRGLPTNLGQENQQTSYTNFGNSMQVSIWPVPVVPYLCSCCQVLREIIHTKGTHTTKLEIHGRLGMICHAILENQNSVNMVPQGNKHQMFDFCKKSIECVKQFLVQYCNERKQAGYIMLQDPLSIFYEALCVGLDWDENLNIDDFFDSSPPDPGSLQMNQPEADNNQAERIPKTSLAAQRERTGRLTLQDFVKYFHLPIDGAAKQLQVCPTVVKKICRKYGLLRWPHRKIKALERQISMLQVSLETADHEERARIHAEIVKIQQEITTICGGLPRG